LPEPSVSEVVSLIQALFGSIQGSEKEKEKEQFRLIQAILLTELTQQKTPEYERLSLDVGFSMITKYPSIISERLELIPLTVNWYSYKALLDLNGYQNQKNVLVDILKRSVSKNKGHIKNVLGGLLTGSFLAEEKHDQLKGFLEPLLPQYIGLGHSIVLTFLQSPELFVTTKDTWEPEFIKYLDVLCSYGDPTIAVAAWEIQPPSKNS